MHPKEAVERVIALYADGWGQKNISRMTDISEAAVVRILRGQHRHNNVRLMNGKRPANEIRSNTKQFGRNTNVAITDTVREKH